MMLCNLCQHLPRAASNCDKTNKNFTKRIRRRAAASDTQTLLHSRAIDEMPLRNSPAKLGGLQVALAGTNRLVGT